MSHNNKNLEKNLDKAFTAFWKVTVILFQMVGHGLKRIDFKSIEFKVYGLCFVGFVFGLTYRHRYINWAHKVAPEVFTEWVSLILKSSPWPLHYMLIFTWMGFVVLILLGLRSYREKQSFQKKLNEVNLKSGQGTPPKIVAIEKSGEFRTRLVINSKGVGLDTYSAKKSDLASSFNSLIESIQPGRSPQFVEILLTTKVLPTRVDLASMIGYLKKPYSIVVGESLGGIVTTDISTLPHMLIAGSTGGGKSVFFKQVLLGLLHSSNHIQMYLLDLKGGVEMKEFGDLPNVRVIKNESEAVHVLTKIRDEMKRRFTILEKCGHKNIVSKRDKLDKIIIGIDEASELYTMVSNNRSKKKLILQARELTDELAKLARAASIHLIFATQKINKDTMDPKVQENIGGRVCFRVNTMENSMRAIGNKMAFELPDIKGRAIWATGNSFTEIQAPFISDEDLKEKVSFIQKKYKGKKNFNFNPMIEVKMNKIKSQDGLFRLSTDSS